MFFAVSWAKIPLAMFSKMRYVFLSCQWHPLKWEDHLLFFSLCCFLGNCEQKYTVLWICPQRRHQRQWHLNHTWWRNASQLLLPFTLRHHLTVPASKHGGGKTKYWLRSKELNRLHGSVQETGLVFGNQIGWELKKSFRWEAKVFKLPKPSLAALTWTSRLRRTGRLGTFTPTGGWTWVFAGGSKRQAFFLASRSPSLRRRGSSSVVKGGK